LRLGIEDEKATRRVHLSSSAAVKSRRFDSPLIPADLFCFLPKIVFGVHGIGYRHAKAKPEYRVLVSAGHQELHPRENPHNPSKG
jgi:hypothetical protein